jgi:hypothetical protein
MNQQQVQQMVVKVLQDIMQPDTSYVQQNMGLAEPAPQQAPMGNMPPPMQQQPQGMDIPQGA